MVVIHNLVDCNFMLVGWFGMPVNYVHRQIRRSALHYILFCELRIHLAVYGIIGS